jgi:HEAT repeat protein
MKRLIWSGTLAAALYMSGSAHADDVAAWKRDLQSGDDAHAEDAAKKLAGSKDARATEAILDVLAMGVAPRHANLLLGALAGRRETRAVELLAVFSHNRNPEVRKRALTVLGSIPDAKVVPLLVDGLSDTTPEVRAEAAAALGKRKEKGAEGKLLMLLERQDSSAPAALAAIATPELVHKLAERIGPIPDGLLCDTLGEILKRPDFGPDALRVEIIKTLQKIPVDASTVALQEYIQATQKDPKRPSRVEAEAIVKQRSGS